MVTIGTPGRTLSELTDTERSALASLLEASQWLSMLVRSLELRGAQLEAKELAGYADRIGVDVCRLVGIELETGPPEREVGLMTLRVERHTERLWSGHADSRSEQATGHYVDAPTRTVAMAMSLVTLARILLDCAPDDTGGERDLEERLASVVATYDTQHAWTVETPEMSCHGEHFD